MSDEDKKSPPPATAVVAPSSDSSPSIAQALYTAETLVQVFGFSPQAANEAVDAVGVDVTQCYNYILDQNLGVDKGGAIYPIDNCPHMNIISTKALLEDDENDSSTLEHSKIFDQTCQYQTPKENYNPKQGNLKEELDDHPSSVEKSSCPKGENWWCLTCRGIFCSRYVNGHGVQHWKDTKGSSFNSSSTMATVHQTDLSPVGHCLAVSLADLSVWCHECEAYLVHDEKILKPIIQKLEECKFGK